MKSLCIDVCSFCCVLAILCSPLIAQQEKPKADETKKADKIPTIDDKCKDMQRFEGFVPFYWEEKTGKIWIELDHFDRELLYVQSLATGLGSNPVGLDRGKLGSQKVVRFMRVGPKILMFQRNLRFRALTKNAAERNAVEQSFAQSVVWGGKVAAEQEGRVLVDFTDMLMTDVQGIAGTLARTGQGDFSVDKDRSAIYLQRCKAFPKNTELEATLTFKGKKPGGHVRQTAPSANSVSFRQHHSFVELPDENYRPRRYDVRCPSMTITFADYASAIDAPLEKRWILRHRLVKKDPDAKISESVEPIVYYVDAGAPKQIQEALVEGASWWNQAFEAAGFKNAFVVKILPADADPLDVRYNVIQWVHRSTRGWSYGGSVSDPRTGEIIKGHVTLGSLRVRQDRLLFEGLGRPVAADGSSPSPLANCGMAGVPEEGFMAGLGNNDPVQVALARIRQLSAHEVGHTLGFVHNFAASTYDDRASVMDYPAPRVKIAANDRLDFSDAYAVGIGSWDKVSVQYAYSQFAPGANEKNELDKILDDAAVRKMTFISDSDSRPASAAHPAANLWDNGTNPLDELKHLLRVRQIALKNFDPRKLPADTTTADIEQYLVPVYLYHRYQIQAVGKMLAGAYYEYGHARNPTAIKKISIQDQNAAIDLLLQCLATENLALDQKLVDWIAPQPRSTIRSSETFSNKTGRTFDAYEPPRVAIDMVLDELLNVERLNRLDSNSKHSPRKCIQRIALAVGSRSNPNQSEVVARLNRIKRKALVEKLIEIIDHPKSSVDTSSAAMDALKVQYQESSKGVFSDDRPIPRGNPELADEQAFRLMISRKIKRFLDRPHEVAPKAETPTIPPGSPIGGGRKR